MLLHLIADLQSKRMYSNMETAQFEREALANIAVEVEKRFAQMDDLAHGWEHVSRVYALALRIAEQENADRFVVGVAALMHDLGRTVQADSTKHHADLSVALAKELLATYQVSASIQGAILHAIMAHSFSRGIPPRTLEARIVRDADRLDSLGAIGILRWAITGTLRRTPQTRTHHPTDPFAEQHSPDDRSYMLDHFFSKLLKLGDTMATNTGRKLAQQRIAFMHSYLDELRKELE
jgi:uncharacterized protein